VPVKVSQHLKTEHVALVPVNFFAVPVNSLLMRKRRVDRVRIVKVVS